MKYRTGDKVMSRKIAKIENAIIRDIAKPKHKYLNLGRLSVHYDQARTSYHTEGVWHAPIYFPAQLRILWMSKKTVRVWTIKSRR